MTVLTRRDFLGAAALAASLGSVSLTGSGKVFAQEKKGADIRFGLVTYQWGKDWDLPTLIENCSKAGALGVELRTTHKHGVEPSLNEDQRAEVRKRFADSDVRCVGIGSNERYDNPDPAVVKKAIEDTKAFVILSHDIGGTGVKVKPDSFHKGVPREKTIEQIGRALNELGEFASGFGQQIRLEVHGQCCQLPTIKSIMDVATHENVAVCWNSNPQDLEAPGLEHNFNLVKDRFGATAHIHRIESKTYPHRELLELYVRMDYAGWLMLEEGTVPAHPAEELAVQRKMFGEMLAQVREKVG